MKNFEFRFCLVSALGAFCTLLIAAIWMGGLNQDEGWYLYAANMVAEGKMLYRDFAFTQGPILPIVYSFFTGIWAKWGLLGARIFTACIGAMGIVFACAMAIRLSAEDKRAESALITFMLLATNLYHLYYVSIPKTYALATFFVGMGFYLLTFRRLVFFAGVALAMAAGARISLSLLLVVVVVWCLCKRDYRMTIQVVIGGSLGLAIVYGAFILDGTALAGLLAAQKYHAARSGFDIAWVVGSLSRLVRWYLPIFVIMVIGGHEKCRMLLWAFLTVFAVQMMAPFPYEDYQVPLMILLAVFASVNFAAGNRRVLLVMAICFGCSFGSPLLEQWAVNGQDRFWSMKKDKFELAQLQSIGKKINAMDPDGKILLTQDLYLAIETNRKVPEGLEMGPFSMLSDEEWKKLLDTTQCSVAALSGYTFAIEPPKCTERPMEKQVEYWERLRKRYELVGTEMNFGQNHTTLLLLKRK